MPIAAAPATDADAVFRAVRARLALGPEQASLRDALLPTLAPDRWTIEWNLPRWLGTRLGLPDDVVATLVESDVLGLVAVRLTDNVVDGEVAASDVQAARELSSIALTAALRPYRELFPPTSPFWPFAEQSLAAWRSGADGQNLATRAAPVRIPAYACCLLAGQLALWPVLERCLDRAMTALVLYDQFVDWESDVEAGRWNAFAAAVVGDEQRRGRSARTRAAVLTAMLTRDVVSQHFERIAAEAAVAAQLGDELGLRGLAIFMRDWAGRTAAQGDGVATHYRRVADDATRLLFPHPIGTFAGGGQ